MTISDNHPKSIVTNVSNGEAEQHNFKLPNDFRTLSAMKDAITKKMAEMQTTGAETLRSMLLQESEALGMSPEEILHGSSGRKPRARKAKSKRDE